MMRSRILSAFVFSFLVATPSFADIALDASLGAIAPSTELTSADLDFTGHLWYQFDQMVFLGAAGGVQGGDAGQRYPALASLWVRLPIGGQVLPVGTGDWGYAFGQAEGFLWRAGGGFDIKNGDRSSLLLLSGWQKDMGLPGRIYLRAGLLLEF